MEKKDKNNKIILPKWLRIVCLCLALVLSIVYLLFVGGKTNSTAQAYNDLQLFNPFYGSVTINTTSSGDSPILGDFPSFLPSTLNNNNVIGSSPYDFRYSTLVSEDFARIVITYNSNFTEYVPAGFTYFNLSFSNRWLTLQELYTDNSITFISEPYGRKQIFIYYDILDIGGKIVSGTAGAILGIDAYEQISLTTMLENSAVLNAYSPTYDNAYFFVSFEIVVIDIMGFLGGNLTINIPYNDYGFSNEEYLINQSYYDNHFVELAGGSALNWTQVLVANVNSFLDIELLPRFSFRDILWLALAIPLVMWFLKMWLGG